MRILFIGGTRMTGPFAVRALLDAGHEVTLLHRTHSDSPLLHGAEQWIGDKSELPLMRQHLVAMKLDVIVHMIAFNEADAAGLLEAAAGIVPRAVIISSGDVYRAFGRVNRTEPGPPDPTPLNEDAPLRTAPLKPGSTYEKIAIERIAGSDPRLACTILRYPAVYGPGDAQHRLHDWVRRMDDHRPFILIGQRQARWRFTHGYVENVAAATVCAIIHPAAAGGIYNVGEPETPTWSDRIREVGHAAGWRGKVVILPEDQLPPHLAEDADFAQDVTLDTSRIRSELGYAEPIAQETGIQRALEWERQSGPPADLSKFNYAAEDAAVGAASVDERSTSLNCQGRDSG